MHARHIPTMRMGVLGPLHALFRYMAYTAVITALLFLASISHVGVAPAAASNLDVVVEHVTDLGIFKGRHYLQVEGLMVRSFTREDGSPGSYSVPLIMAFPAQDGRAGNGVGLVDVPNSADFGVTPDRPLTEENITQWALLATDDYLFREGYTYLSVQWNKMVTDRLGVDPPPGRPRRLGYGVIEMASDSTQILRDASHLLRHPVSLGDLGQPEPVEHVLAFGYSQTAFVMNQFIDAGSNQGVGGLLYDGFALSVNIRAFIVPAIPLPADQGKIISLYTETDLQFFRAALNRASGESDFYRHYELAGVAHLPKPLLPLDSLGATRQNPANLAPAQRAVIDNLVAWIRHGDEPPPSKFIDGTLLPDGTFLPERDADGNALGGLRLPHMPSVLCDDDSHNADDCRPAGAPLGTYTGLETDNVPVPPNTNLYVMWGGTFEPFSPQDLKERYRNRGNYVQLVRRAAQELRKQGYILPEDYRKYVSDAAHQALW
jgi:alpha/beta hydrolase family protein